MSAIQSKVIYRFVLSLCATICALMLSEIGYKIYINLGPSQANESNSLYVWDENSPEIYFHNVMHPEINELGYRNCKSENTSPNSDQGDEFRILFLGDSVTYGHGVSCEQAFPSLIERKNPVDPSLRVKSFNAGVRGYNTYNQYQSYIVRGRAVRPNLVILATVLNDFANPRLHWANDGKNEIPIPTDAIPDKHYDRNHGIPAFIQLRNERENESYLIPKLFQKAKSIFRKPTISAMDSLAFPTFITGEDAYPITRLLSINSPGLKWYSNLVAQLREAVESDGAQLLVIIIPLSYQIEPNYPYFPQSAISAICSSLGVPCLDILPEFRKFSKQKLYLEEDSGYIDIWHLSAEGHLVLADCLAAFLSTYPHLINETRQLPENAAEQPQ